MRIVRRLILASVFAFSLAPSYSTPIKQPPHYDTRDIKQASLLDKGRSLELYGFCPPNKVTDLDLDRLAEVKPEESFVMKVLPESEGVVQLIHKSSEQLSPYIELHKQGRGRYLVDGYLTKPEDGRVIKEQLEGEFRC